MTFFTLWVLPPLVGAIIGLFTNWLAIKMLFKPLREIRVMGVRVPFTPGILPRERYRISRSIGDTVARELLTEDVLRKRLSDPSVRGAVADAMLVLLDKALAVPAADAIRPNAPLVPVSDLTGDATSDTILSEAFDRSLRTLAESDAFRGALEKALEHAVSMAGSLPLSHPALEGFLRTCFTTLLGPGDGTADPARIDGFLDVLERFGRQPVDRAAGETVAGPDGSDMLARIASAFPPGLFDPLVSAVSAELFRASIPAIEGLLKDREVRGELGLRAAGLVRRAVARLDPIQRFVVAVGNFEAKIVDGIPEMLDDLAGSVSELLRGPGLGAKLVTAVSGNPGYAGHAGDGASGRTGRCCSGEGREAIRKASAAALAGLRRERDSIVRGIVSALDPSGEGTVASLADSLDPRSLSGASGAVADPPDASPPVHGGAGSTLAKALAGLLSEALASPGIGGNVLAPVVFVFRSALADRLGGVSIGEALGLDGDMRIRLASEAADRILRLLVAEASGIVEGLDVRKIVVERIDELDIGEVERIILDVVKNELAWITAIGGVLGACIGLAQSFLYRFS